MPCGVGGTRIGSYALCTQLAMRLVESIRAKVPNRGHLLHRAGCSGNVPLNPLGTAAHGGPAVGWPVGELVEGAVARRRVVVRLWLVRAGTAARPCPPGCVLAATAWAGVGTALFISLV